MIVIPVSALIGFFIGWWYKIYDDDRKENIRREAVRRDTSDKNEV